MHYCWCRRRHCCCNRFLASVTAANKTSSTSAEGQCGWFLFKLVLSLRRKWRSKKIGHHPYESCKTDCKQTGESKHKSHFLIWILTAFKMSSFWMNKLVWTRSISCESTYMVMYQKCKNTNFGSENSLHGSLYPFLSAMYYCVKEV